MCTNIFYILATENYITSIIVVNPRKNLALPYAIGPALIYHTILIRYHSHNFSFVLIKIIIIPQREYLGYTQNGNLLHVLRPMYSTRKIDHMVKSSKKYNAYYYIGKGLQILDITLTQT